VNSLEINKYVNELLYYGLVQKLIRKSDVDFVANQLLDLLQIKRFKFEEVSLDKPIDLILAGILDYAVLKGLINNDTVDERDLFDTKVMGLLMPRPSEINDKFESLYKEHSKKATDYFYHISKASNYIRTERIKADKRWKVKTIYGEFDITINLSKPEKDPKTIALAKSLPNRGYPLCVLCKENVGYAGHHAHPARQNHRIIPVELANEAWYLQYSPYVYYNEHCIVFKGEHAPMVISKKTFECLLDFVKQYKHYFVGANADLPIVGGSILSHDHFQGGVYTFPMDNAEVLREFEILGFDDVKVGLLRWPLTTLRLKAKDTSRLVALATIILQKWRGYSDENLGIYAETEGVPHNTITPITRYRNEIYEIDLVLRNNKISSEHPDGIYHSHKRYHHLKKENIGLIEVMGLAVLPGRLLGEIDVLKEALLKRSVAILENVGLDQHKSWYDELQACVDGLKVAQLEELIKQSIGLKFAEILECCGVFKLDDEGLVGIEKFIGSLI
jgi:UDPglucose--hexose-1-phosphate uridylyltransferase